MAALFKPRGLFGLCYWYAIMPFHDFVFRRMLNGIRREALQIAAQKPHPDTDGASRPAGL